MKLGTLLVERVKSSPHRDFYLISSPDCETWCATGLTIPDVLEELAQKIRKEALRRYEADVQSLEG